MEQNKKIKLKTQVNKFVQYFVMSLFCVSSFCLSALLLISYVFGIILGVKNSGILNNNNILNNNDVFGKILTVLIIILTAIIILGVIALVIYILVRLCLRYLKSIDSNVLEYYLYNKRWKDCIYAIVLSLLTIFAFRYLFNYLISFHNTTMSIILAVSYLLVAIILFVNWLYQKLWFNKQTPQYKQKVINILKEIEDKKLEKKTINSKKHNLVIEEDNTLKQEENVDNGEIVKDEKITNQ